MGSPIYHIATEVDWLNKGEIYVPAGFAEEGFIHLSTAEQVLATANTRFNGRQDLGILVVDPSGFGDALVYEDLYGSGQEFPHLYAELPLDAITSHGPFRPGPDGTFEQAVAGLAKS